MHEVLYDPTPEVVKKVNNLVLPLVDEPAYLDKLADRFTLLYGELVLLVDEKSEITQPATAALSEAQLAAALAKSSLQEAQITAQITTEDLGLVRYRVRNLLLNTNPEFMPFWLRIIRSRFTPLPDPLVPLEGVVSNKVSEIEKARIELSKAKKQAEAVETKIGAKRSRLGQVKNDLIVVWEPPFINNYELASSYVTLFPGRAEEFSGIYADLHKNDPSWMDYFPTFKKDLTRIYPHETQNAKFVDREWRKYVAAAALADWRA